MTFLKKAYLRASNIPGFHWGELVCLMLLSFFMGVALCGYDVAAVRLYFEHVPLSVMGYDFIYIAFLLIFFWLSFYLYRICFLLPFISFSFVLFYIYLY